MATVAEVEVNRQTGAVRVKRFVCVHDCGLIVDPEALAGTVSANLVQSLSRSLKEEVTFDGSRVTSVDWNSYPIARASDIPDQVDITLINTLRFHRRRRRTIQPAYSRRDRQRNLRCHGCTRATRTFYTVESQSRARHGSARLTDRTRNLRGDFPDTERRRGESRSLFGRHEI